MDLKSNRYEIDFNETGFTVEIQIDMKLISMKLVSQLTPHGLEIRWIDMKLISRKLVSQFNTPWS